MIKSVLEWKKYLEDRLNHFRLYVKDPNITKQKLNIDSDMSFITLEEYFLTISFGIRKIYESNKLPKELFQERIKVKRYRRYDEYDSWPVSPDFYHHSYNLKENEDYELELIPLGNLFIHSLVFAPHECIAMPYSEERYLMRGVNVNSPNASKFLYFVDIVDYFNLIERFITSISHQKFYRT